MCEVVSKASKTERETGEVHLAKIHILAQLRRLDDDDDGQINMAEMLHLLHDPEAVTVFHDLEVDVRYVRDLQSMLYEDTDTQQPIEDIMKLILNCRGGRPATVRDLVDALTFIRWMMAKSFDRQDQHLETAIAHMLHIKTLV